jgi:hypothetical protein
MFREATVEELTSIALLLKKALSGGDIHPLPLTISKIIAKKSYKLKFYPVQAAEKLSGQYTFRESKLLQSQSILLWEDYSSL